MDRSRLVIPVVVPLLWMTVPVRADTGSAACREGAACVWGQTDFRGKRAQVPPNGCIDTSIRSAVNASDEALELFMGAGCHGLQAGTLQPGEEASDIHAGSATRDCDQGAVDSCTPETPPTPEG